MPSLDRRQQIDAGIARKGLGDRQPLRRGKRIDRLAAKRNSFVPAARAASRQQRRAIIHQRLVRLIRPIPFQHREFRVMQRAALAVAEHAREIDDARLARRQELLAGEFRRRAQIKRRPLAARPDQVGCEGMQMCLVAGRNLQAPPSRPR